MKVCIIIPVFNESQIICSLLSNEKFAKYDLVIVDDGSVDFPQFEEISNAFYLIRHNTNLGQGAALQTGMEYAKLLQAEIVVHFDADGQHNVEDIDILICKLIHDKCDVIIGSRFLKNENGVVSKVPCLKLLILEVAKIVQYIFSGIKLSDSQNGFRALSKKAYQTVNITENRMAHAIEFVQICRKKGFIIEEAAVKINYTKYSTEKGQKIANGLFIVIKLFLNLMIQDLYKSIFLLSAAIIIVVYILNTHHNFNYYLLLFSVFCIVIWIFFHLFKKMKQKMILKTKQIREEALKHVKKIYIIS